ATWPEACTPASVRPATVSGARSRRSAIASARSSSPWTVRSPGCAAHPRKSVPSYSISSRTTGSEPATAVRLDELEQDHLGRGRATRTELQDPRVAAVALLVARGDLLEQLVDRELVLAEHRQRLATRVQVAALAERDQLLDLGLDRLGLGLGRLDPLVLDD